MPIDNSDAAAELQRKGFVVRHNYVGSGQGSVCRVVEFAPGGAKFMHRTEATTRSASRANADLELYDGRTVPMKAGDICVQRGTMHAWVAKGSEAIRNLLQTGDRACSFSTCVWLLDYAGPGGNSRLRFRQCGLPVAEHSVGARNSFFEARFLARRCLCLHFTRHLAAPSARLEVKMVRYSFLVGLFHPRLHAGLSRRLRSLTRAAPDRAATVGSGCLKHRTSRSGH